MQNQGEREDSRRRRRTEMKSIRGRIIRKLKSISTLTSLNPSLVFQHLQLQNSTITKECDQNNGTFAELVDPSPDILVPEIFKDVQEGENEKTEFKITVKSQEKLGAHDHSEENEKTLQNGRDKEQLLSESQSLQIQPDSKGDAAELLQEFEEKCPPGGRESVVFYTTSFRGIRKTFEDCSAIRFLLESFGVVYDERDISMHLEYREELWTVMGRKIVPPRLFIRGKHIGGADVVVGLHEQGLLRKLLQGIPLTPSNRPCSGCAGVRFVLCLNCNGSRKITTPEGQGCGNAVIRCLDCNENGLVKCPICS